MDLNNEKRVIASQIIVELYEAGQRSQLELLATQIRVSLENLDKPAAQPSKREDT